LACIRLRGYAAIRKVLAGMSPVDVVELVKTSSLRAAGGGVSLRAEVELSAQGSSRPDYMCVNADESNRRRSTTAS